MFDRYIEIINSNNIRVLDKMKKKVNGDNSFKIDETISIKNNQGSYVITIEDYVVPNQILLKIYRFKNDKSKSYILTYIIRQEKELYGVINKCLMKVNCYFNFVLTDITELETASTYVLDRMDNVYSISDIMNHLRFKNFNKEFDLVEFSVILLNNLDLVNSSLLNEVKDKLNYFGVDDNSLPFDKYAVLLQFKNSPAMNWFKISSKEFANKILEILILELYEKAVTKRFLLSEIKHYLSTIYGMYIYRLYYEHKGEL